MGTIATAGLRLLELTQGDYLLRFHAPLDAELEVFPGEGASIWISELGIGATGSSTEEALDMLGDLVITMYLTYRDGGEGTLSPEAKQQMHLLLELTAGLFVRQP